MRLESFANLTIVVCTKDRLGSLRKLLESCIPLIAKGNVKILIIDSSVPPIQIQDLNLEASTKFIHENIEIYYEEPGLPRARNRALINVSSSLVTFVDDDVMLPESFSERILSHFNKFPLTIGVAPLIQGMHKDYKILESDSVFARVYKHRVLNSFGKVSKYGENFWFPEDFTKDCEMCEWLPGCCMTYNFSLLGDLKFNNSLENGPGKSYAVGEDVDFSLRASDFGPLYVLGSLMIHHREEAGARDNNILMAQARGTFRAYLTYQKRISMLPVFFHMNLNIVVSLCRLVLGRPNASRMVRENVTCLFFYLRELFVKNLSSDRLLSQ